MPEQCQMRRYEFSGTRRTTIACNEPAAWVYINGAYRRLECNTHAARTRSLIRHPDVIRLVPIEDDARTAPEVE